MNRIVSLLVLVPSIAFAFPRELPHQGRLTDALGEPLDGTYDVHFTLWDAPSLGNDLWTETLSVDAADGYYATVLGTTVGNELQDAWFEDNAALYLGIAIGTEPEMTPRQRLMPAPYALVAGSVDGGSVAASDVSVTGPLTLGTVTEGACGTTVGDGTLRWNGTDDVVEVCVGTAWEGLTGSGGNDGSTAANAASSCDALHTSHPSLPSNAYWIDLDGPTGDPAFQAYCDMVTDDGGWTWVIHTNTSGQYSSSTTYNGSGGYSLANVPPHSEIATMLYRGGTLEAGIASARLNPYVRGQTGTSLIDYSASTWEMWSSAWATYTGYSAATCWHGSWQDTCVQSSYIGTCNGGSSHANDSSSSWVGHGGCSNSGKSDVEYVLAVR